MLERLLRLSLRNQLLTFAMAIAVCVLGSWYATRMPIDVFPDLDRPRVVIMTEAPGLAPEEIESLVTLPIESSVNGATGVQAVRSTSTYGMSIVYVEFDFTTPVYQARQWVTERLVTVQDRLPTNVRPQLAPISSVMGQIMVVGLTSTDPKIDPTDLRTIADYSIRQRLISLPGVAQVFTMGGGRLQFHVVARPESLQKFGVKLEDIERGLAGSNVTTTGGIIDGDQATEWVVRAIGKIHGIEDLKRIPISNWDGRPIPLEYLATIELGNQTKRGDASVFIKDKSAKNNQSSVVLTISKQPGSDTKAICQRIRTELKAIQAERNGGVSIETMYSQDEFIHRAIENVFEALRDGGLLVVIVLFLFLMNIRTTFISLTAIPLSILTTVIVFYSFGLTINTMTLGGLAVAIGELVDDAIVDVENIYRRLKENGCSPTPKPLLRVVFDASIEVRSSIVYSTIIVCIVFIPLFGLSGMEGRLFAPLGIAYVVSIIASLLISLSITPVLSYWFLANTSDSSHHRDSITLRILKRIVEVIIRFSLRHPVLNLALVTLLVIISAVKLGQLNRDFLPPFNEGSIQLNVLLPPGTSLASSIRFNEQVEGVLRQLEIVERYVRRTGRAELDEHAEPVSSSEYIIELSRDSSLARSQQLNLLREKLSSIPGIVFSVEQPISHLISHMLSGVKAQIGLKIYGDDLDRLRKLGETVKSKINRIDGVKDLILEQQVLIPQIRIDYDREQLLQSGVTVDQINSVVELATQGRIVTEFKEGRKSIDVVLKYNEGGKVDFQELKRLTIQTPSGARLPITNFATIIETLGPNTIQRENTQRRIVVQCNVSQRGLVDVVEDIKSTMADIRFPDGYFVEYSGQYESQQRASNTVYLLYGLALIAVFFVLHNLFGSWNLAIQVMMAVPMAFIGAVIALVVTNQTITIASLVGFVSLTGIATRNGILLLQHYLHLVEHENEDWSREMIVRAGLERLAPVLMTALTAGIGLFPLVLAAGQPGKEILYPVATIIFGGVISSTLLDFFVHPALFWLMGRNAARTVVARRNNANLSHF